VAGQEGSELTMEKTILAEEDLHAFIDGELDDARAEAVAAIIAASPELSERVERLILDKDLIARAYGPLIELPLPDAMRQTVTQYHPVQPVRAAAARSFFPAAMALAAAIVAAVIAYPILSNLGGDPLVTEAMAVRAGQVHAERQFADTEIATVTARDQLVETALSVPIKVPNLEKAGYRLTGITAYPDRGGHKALQISYRNRNGVLFTMYMRQTAGADRFELSRRNDMQICVWQNDDLSVVMLGEMPAHEMLRVATATYADLNF
jgi:anti-sigma factor RsiW